MAAGPLRFAGTLLANAWRSPAAQAAIPRTIGGLISDTAFNALGAGMSAVSLPEGTDLGTRLGAAAEDLLFSVPVGWLGRLGGYNIARGVGALRGKRLPPGIFEQAQALTGGAAEMAAWSSGLIPRPFANKAFEQYQARTSEQQLQEQAMRDEQIRMDLVQRLGGAGLLAAPFQQNLGWGMQA